jgi:tripartite-type tricarboxylate transporter receptor subunit TctC
VDRLHTEISRSLADREIKARLEALGNEASGIGPEPFGEYVRKEVARWAGIVEKAGVKKE